MPKKKAARGSAAKPGATAKKRKAKEAHFAATFAGLKKTLAGFGGQLRVTADEPGKYQLVTKANSWKGGPMFFGAVMMGKAYVSYQLMPLYACPELTTAVSPELKKRMQGKSCFNFREPDAALFAQLGEVTKAGLEKYRAKKWM